MRVLALDPGNVQTAALIYDTDERRPTWFTYADNDSVMDGLRGDSDVMAIEMIASYGMAVGATTFDTCVWIGRFTQRWIEMTAESPQLVFRREVKAELCGNQRAKDANIRQALIDMFGPGKDKAVGRKASPGPLYGISGDVWSALAVAVTVAASEERAR